MTWATWPLRAVAFIAWFAWAVVRTNLVVIWDGVTTGQNSTPGIARFETQCRSDFEFTLLAVLITLTPGTLTLGTTPVDAGDPVHGTGGAPRVMYVHGMYADGPDDLRAELRDLERRMLSAVRPRGGTS